MVLPSQGLKVFFRRGRVLPTNADSSVMHPSGIVWLCGKVDTGQRA
jgi:hypothetical protein